MDSIQMHLKSVPYSFLGARMETAGSPDIRIVGNNGIPRGCMSSP
jgi:hypothetical protein